VAVKGAAAAKQDKLHDVGRQASSRNAAIFTAHFFMDFQTIFFGTVGCEADQWTAGSVLLSQSLKCAGNLMDPFFMREGEACVMSTLS
jgi:hypothetical protein